MTGYTEFTSINLKGVFNEVDLIKQKITTDIIYQGNAIATLYFDMIENSVRKEGNFEDIKHLQVFGIDEQYIVSRIKPQLTMIITSGILNPEEFNI